MSKKLPFTPKTQVRSALRRLWLKSRERAAALKRDDYRCQQCGKKQSRAAGREVKVEVHHKDGVLNWAELDNAIRRGLLCHPGQLVTLCKKCHSMEGKKDE